jgi:hypothetical protein
MGQGDQVRRHQVTVTDGLIRSPRSVNSRGLEPGNGMVRLCSLMTVATMGIDIGKNSFHVVGFDQRGESCCGRSGQRRQIETPKHGAVPEWHGSLRWRRSPDPQALPHSEGIAYKRCDEIAMCPRVDGVDLSDDGPGQHNLDWSEGPRSRATHVARMAVFHQAGGLRHCT